MFGLKRDKRSAEAGFSLVETVAAMGILALAAVPLMQVASDSTRNTGALENRLLARTVAENILSEFMADPELQDAGIRSGQETQLGRAYDWKILIGPVTDGQLQQFQVSVRRGGDAQILASLSSLKAVTRAIVPVEPDGGAPS